MNGSALVRVATFNVLHGRQVLDDGRPSLTTPGTATVQPLVDAVAALDADVVALQELDRFQERSDRADQARAVAAATGAAAWRYASAFHARSLPGRVWRPDSSEPGLRVYGPPGAGHDGRAPSHGVALLSRLPVLSWRARRFSAPPLALPLPVAGGAGLTVIRDHPRAALAAVLEGPRGPFTAVALHLSFVPGWNVRQLLAVHRWIADLPRPHVLLGDFNLGGTLPTAVLGAAELRSPSTPRPGWRDLARVPTFPAHRPRVQLDHILATGLDSPRPNSAQAPRMPVSDHRPLVVELPL
ncbi:endonuclease/exonuclease/phosphatase family protein [Kitasatospora paracochleata]|uniref:Endonuclease/exonuclease/phosphatase family metal-dependent hydrolase n=3 Tax=Kitasatospora paracochleata TaxID=58354 RepID=A0ABT1J9A6_9ACTN|nr:endonuclease/exonuclease/phosphatase family protein [Kitasatospora paracochleata]MCP2313648.1 endonuclease/exonuclease/phosphatase family metal-dependent hydrolase [Kitasatospora paracochleata]